VAATIENALRFAFRISPENDVLAEQREGEGRCGKLLRRNDGLPEAAQDGLLGDEHWVASESWRCSAIAHGAFVPVTKDEA
jgi:hypothetical protein